MRVLVVEDNRELALSVKKGLEQENISVDLAYDGELGEEKAFVNSYDGILLDLNLPKKDGLDVLQSLRDSGVESSVIIITARDEIEERAKGLDFGADDYLVKPFELLELKARLRAVIRRYHGRALPQISIGGLTVDPVCRKASYQKKEVFLKPLNCNINRNKEPIKNF
ncbi:two-component system, OmpR family, response regulator QseB [Enterococcus sp. AZ135]|uniref:response regulator n=1 Tax=unclassified Enterococcus TaxID=2608891 RepID=UPI003F20485F